jgi:hypothetical protein
MFIESKSKFRVPLCCTLLVAILIGGRRAARGDNVCPTASDEIATDRPDVTNSSLVVPAGSLQAENGVDWSERHGPNAVGGTKTRLRVGIAHCSEFLLDVPSYFASVSGTEPSGFSNVAISFKRQFAVPFGFNL